MTSWSILLKNKIEELGEDIETLDLLLENETAFNSDRNTFGGYLLSDDSTFTAWTTNYVYYPLIIDGVDNIGYANYKK